MVDSVDELRKRATGCEACDLYARATQTVFGEGPVHAPLMLMDEQPGDQENKEGKPFVGPAGGVLDRALDAARIDRDAVYVTNAVKHFKWEPRGKARSVVFTAEGPDRARGLLENRFGKCADKRL